MVFLNLQLMGEMMGNIQMIGEKLSEKSVKVNATTPKSVVGSLQVTVP